MLQRSLFVPLPQCRACNCAFGKHWYIFVYERPLKIWVVDNGDNYRFKIKVLTLFDWRMAQWEIVNQSSIIQKIGKGKQSRSVNVLGNETFPECITSWY